MEERSAHQPLREFVAPSEPTSVELSQQFQRGVLVIDATDPSTTPLKVQTENPDDNSTICGANDDEKPLGIPRPLQRYQDTPAIVWSLRCANATGAEAIYVAVGDDPALSAGIESAIKERSEGDTPIVCVPASKLPKARRDFDEDARAIFDIPATIIGVAHEALKDHPNAEFAVIMASDQVRITPRHLLELAKRYRATEQCDIVTSWIEWQRRTPMLFDRALLGRWTRGELSRLTSMTDCATRAYRPFERLHVQEVVFGEEKLAANEATPAKVEAFFSEKHPSMLEAIRKASAERKRKDAGEPDQPTNSTTAPISATTAAMTNAAFAAIERGNSVTRELGENEIAAVDAWGRRNKADFPLFAMPEHAATLVYLDSAATSQRLSQALTAQYHFDACENANVYRGAYSLSAKATETFNKARAALERFIGADRRETVYTRNTSDSCNLVAQAWGNRMVHKGDLIVLPLSEHHSNMLPWRMLADRAGARVEYLTLSPDGRIDLTAYDNLLSQRPVLVCCAHISNLVGIVNPVEEMARRAHSVGARFFLDAAQSFAHLPLDVKKLGADFVAFSGHKAYGPTGIGGLWISPDAFDEMDPVGSGGGAISHVGEHSYYLRSGAIQYELGTPPVGLAIGLAAATDHLTLLGHDAIERHDRIMTDYLIRCLTQIDGVEVWGDHSGTDGKAGLVSFSVEDATPSEVGAFLGALGVAVRSGGHCALPISAAMGVTGTTRISMGIHTTREDLDAATAAVDLCRRAYSNRRHSPKAEGKSTVTAHYAEVASNILASLDSDATVGHSSCCESPATVSEAAALYAREITESLPAGATAASRGCGDPIAKANLAPGERVLDLGSGGGIDALIAARLVGESGCVYGVDMTESMIKLARRNASDARCSNVEFIHGNIEDLPLPDGSVDVVLSNCVINFSSDKAQVFREAHRVLAAKGRMVVSDIVAFAPVPASASAAINRITGCTNGMLVITDYEKLIRAAGFSSVRLEPKTRYTLEVLREKAKKKHREESFAAIDRRPDVDGLCGSVIIYAEK